MTKRAEMVTTRMLALAGLALMGAWAPSVWAWCVNVDLNYGAGGTYSGVGVAPDAGTYWNGVTVPYFWNNPHTLTSGPLLDSTGGTSSITFTLANHGGYYEAGANYVGALLNDYAAFETNINYGMTISGLVAGASYDLYLYMQNTKYGSAGLDFVFGGITNTALNIGNVDYLKAGGNYVVFTGLVAEVNGTIEGTLRTKNPNRGALNGFQIMPTPRPMRPQKKIVLDDFSADSSASYVRYYGFGTGPVNYARTNDVFDPLWEGGNATVLFYWNGGHKLAVGDSITVDLYIPTDRRGIITISGLCVGSATNVFEKAAWLQSDGGGHFRLLGYGGGGADTLNIGLGTNHTSWCTMTVTRASETELIWNVQGGGFTSAHNYLLSRTNWVGQEQLYFAIGGWRASNGQVFQYDNLTYYQPIKGTLMIIR